MVPYTILRNGEVVIETCVRRADAGYAFAPEVEKQGFCFAEVEEYVFAGANLTDGYRSNPLLAEKLLAGARLVGIEAEHETVA